MLTWERGEPTSMLLRLKFKPIASPGLPPSRILRQESSDVSLDWFSGNGASNSEFHGPCSMVSLHFLKLQGCPSWVFRLVEKVGSEKCRVASVKCCMLRWENFLKFDASDSVLFCVLSQGQYLKGKLICPKCCGRVGAFDFIHRNMCECGNHAVEPIHVLKGRVDERKTNGLAFPLHKIPKSLAPELQVAKTLQEAEVTSLEASQLLVSTRHPQGETRASFPDDETVLSPKTSEIGVEMSVAPLNTMTNASRAVVQPSDKCETPGHLTGEKDSDWKSYNKFSPLEVTFLRVVVLNGNVLFVKM